MSGEDLVNATAQYNQLLPAWRAISPTGITEGIILELLGYPHVGFFRRKVIGVLGSCQKIVGAAMLCDPRKPMLSVGVIPAPNLMRTHADSVSLS